MVCFALWCVNALVQLETVATCMRRHLNLESDKVMVVVQAAEGAKEAREWISNWREGETKGMTVRSTLHCT